MRPGPGRPDGHGVGAERDPREKRHLVAARSSVLDLSGDDGEQRARLGVAMFNGDNLVNREVAGTEASEHEVAIGARAVQREGDSTGHPTILPRSVGLGAISGLGRVYAATMTSPTVDRDPKPRGAETGLLARIRRLVSHDQSRIEADELHADALASGATPVRQCCTGERVDVLGTVRSVTVRPRGGAPAFEADVYDGTGSLTVMWLGRRRIRGVDPGRTITVSGRINSVDGQPVMFNPRYAIKPGPGA